MTAHMDRFIILLGINSIRCLFHLERTQKEGAVSRIWLQNACNASVSRCGTIVCVDGLCYIPVLFFQGSGFGGYYL